VIQNSAQDIRPAAGAAAAVDQTQPNSQQQAAVQAVQHQVIGNSPGGQE